MSKSTDKVHGQWRFTKVEVDNGSIYLTELVVPVLYTKEWVRGYRILDKIRAKIARSMH